MLFLCVVVFSCMYMYHIYACGDVQRTWDTLELKLGTGDCKLLCMYWELNPSPEHQVP